MLSWLCYYCCCCPTDILLKWKITSKWDVYRFIIFVRFWSGFFCSEKKRNQKKKKYAVFLSFFFHIKVEYLNRQWNYPQNNVQPHRISYRFGWPSKYRWNIMLILDYLSLIRSYESFGICQQTWCNMIMIISAKLISFD